MSIKNEVLKLFWLICLVGNSHSLYGTLDMSVGSGGQGSGHGNGRTVIYSSENGRREAENRQRIKEQIEDGVSLESQSYPSIPTVQPLEPISDEELLKRIKNSPENQRLEEARNRIRAQKQRRDDLREQIKSMGNYEFRSETLETATEWLKQSRTYIVEKEFELGAIAGDIADTLMDIAVSMTPVVGWVRDCYEAIIGRDLLSQQDLDNTARIIAVAGALTGGFGSKIGKAAQVFQKMMKTSDGIKATAKASAIIKAAEKFEITPTEVKKFAVDLANPPRRLHILHGELKPDGTWSGGHLHPGKSGKTVFPESWNGEKIMHEASDIVTDPKITWRKSLQQGGAEYSPARDYNKAGKPQRFEAIGVRDEVEMKVIIEPAGEGIISSFPLKGSGVTTNPM